MILLTGATGYIGQKVLRSLILNDKRDIIIPVRAKSGIDISERLRNMGIEEKRIQVLEGDIDSLVTGHLDLEKIEIIIHNAALTAFNVDEESANSVNREGSRKVFELASRCPNFKKIIYVSTVYTSGMKPDVVDEVAFDKISGFANHYERSKWEAENILIEEFNHLPWCIARVATVIADDENGKVVQQNAVHNTLKLFFYGLISLLPGNPNTPIYLVTGDFVANALMAIVKNGEPKKMYHISHSFEEALNLGEIIEMAYGIFLEDDNFKNKRILKPLFTDMSSFETLVDNVTHFGGAILSQGVASVAPFGKQLFIPKKIKNDQLKKLMGSDYPQMDMKKLLQATSRYLVSTKFAMPSQKY